MTTTPSLLELARDWLIVIATGLSAVFAGLIWWLARQRFSSRYRAKVTTSSAGSNHIYVEITILNRSDKDLTLEAISVDAPWSLPVSEGGAHFGIADYRKLEEAHSVQRVPCLRVFEPDKEAGFNISVRRDGGIVSAKSVSIRLHILKSFPTVRHKKKVLKAILPANIRNSQA